MHSDWRRIHNYMYVYSLLILLHVKTLVSLAVYIHMYASVWCMWRWPIAILPPNLPNHHLQQSLAAAWDAPSISSSNDAWDNGLINPLGCGCILCVRGRRNWRATWPRPVSRYICPVISHVCSPIIVVCVCLCINFAFLGTLGTRVS